MTFDELTKPLKLFNRIERLKESINSIIYDGRYKSPCTVERVSGGCNVQNMEQVAIEDLDAKITRLRNSLNLEREYIRRFILGFHLEEIQEEILICRYVECLYWKEIAKRIGYTEQQLHSIKRGILKNILVDFSPL
jgi:hypothetical protein